MINLLDETIKALDATGYTPHDVVAITTTTGDQVCDWDSFTALANVEYHNGYGAAKVRVDLAILMKDDTWFERGEYDGAEWWSHKKVPVVAPDAKPLEWVLLD